MGIAEIAQSVAPLHGAPASILLALRFARQPLTNPELQVCTGYTEKSVKRAAQKLIELGHVEALGDSGPWQLKPGFVPDVHSNSGENSGADSGVHADPGNNSGRNSGTNSGGNSVPSSTRSSKNLVVLEPVSLEEKLVLAKEKNLEVEKTPAEIPAKIPARECTTHRPVTRPAADSEVRPDFVANRKALLQAGIHDPAASRLAALRHVTPDFINEHVRRVLAEGKQLALAIFRIEHNFTLPGKSAPDWPPILVNAKDPRPPEYQPESTDPTVWNYGENFHTLMEYRGAEDVAKRIAALPHVSPHFIREHMRQAALHRQDVITALYRIEHNEALPETWIYGLDSKESPDAGIRQLAEELGVAHKRGH